LDPAGIFGCRGSGRYRHDQYAEHNGARGPVHELPQAISNFGAGKHGALAHRNHNHGFR
jgi:hypothetical protein